MSESLWNNDAELIALCKRELFSAVVGDVMDQIGLLHQFLPPTIRALRDDMVVVGRCMTVLEADLSDPPPPRKENQRFGVMLDALDDLKPNEVYLCTGASPTYALWGELMSLRAMKLGAAGAVVDGFHRDTRGILDLGFATFSHGPYAQDQAPRGQVVDFRCPIDFAGVRVNSGDMIFGDRDGVCVIPVQREIEVFTLALEKARGEKLVRQALEGGMSAKQAFDTYGIL